MKTINQIRAKHKMPPIQWNNMYSRDSLKKIIKLCKKIDKYYEKN